MTAAKSSTSKPRKPRAPRKPAAAETTLEQLRTRTTGVATDDGGRVIVDDGGRPVMRTESDPA